MAQAPQSLSKTLQVLELEDPRADVLADVLSSALLRNALYKRLEARAPWGIRIREKSRAAFYLLVRGSALLEVEGEKAITLSAGDIVFLPHGTAHSLRDSKTTVLEHACEAQPKVNTQPRRIGGDGAASSIIAGFFERDSGRVPVLLQRMPNSIVVSPSEPTSDPWLGPTVQLMLAESASAGPASALIINRLADVLFVQVLRSLARHGSCPKGLPALSDPAVHAALALMHGDVKTSWTVARLAKQVGVSRSGLAARFTALVGEPPLQYLMQWRMARAAELLRDTDASVAEVAARVGYESVPSFSKTFKRWRGLSPGAFRRASAQPAEAAAAR